MWIYTSKMFNTMNILFILTLIQFWWIAIWGLAYILIDNVAGTSKIKEIGLRKRH